MNRLLILAALFSLTSISCGPHIPTKKEINAKKAHNMAQAIKYTVNWEQLNIVRRQEMVGQAGLTGFITLFGDAGTGMPIFYGNVAGKVTSGGKRLTPTQYSYGTRVLDAPSNDGTHGHSNLYIYWWDDKGRYFQWNGIYLFSDHPLRLRIDPLVMSIQPEAPPAKPPAK